MTQEQIQEFREIAYQLNAMFQKEDPGITFTEWLEVKLDGTRKNISPRNYKR